MDAIIERILSAIEEHREEILSFARDVYSHAELGYKEYRTSALFEEKLKALGLPTEAGLAITGVKGRLNAEKTGSSSVALLGELDALRIPEHRLANPDTGAAHCCGHHAQLAGVYGAALALTLWKNREDRFVRTALLLCCGQFFWELLRSRAASWHFVRIDQLWCACVLLGFAAAAFLRGGRWQPLLWTVILIGLNAYLQFALDKPELMTALLPEAFGSWIGKNIKPVCHTGFMLTAAGLWAAARQSLKGIYSPRRNMRSMTA